MATSKLLLTEQDGTPKQISFAAHSSGFSPTAANVIEVGTPTDCELTLSPSGTGLANGSYRQSAKVDLGTDRAEEYALRMAVEIAASPTAGNAIEFWWAPSGSGTAGTGNAGGASGTDSAYAGYSSNAAASVKQLIYIGAAIVTAQATGTVQLLEVNGTLRPPERYGSLVVLNGSGAAFHSDDDEINVVMSPIVPEAQ